MTDTALSWSSGKDAFMALRRDGIEGVAIVTGVDSQRISPSLLGRRFDRSFLGDLPEGVDPCGENGEFHTVILDAAEFAAPIEVSQGKTSVQYDRFHTLDLIPEPAHSR